MTIAVISAHRTATLVFLSCLMTMLILSVSVVIVAFKSILVAACLLCLFLAGMAALVKRPQEILFVSALSSILFLASYFAVLGWVLGVTGYVDLLPLKSAIGLRSGIFSIGIATFILIVIFCRKKQERGLNKWVLITASLLVYSFYSSPAPLVPKVTYILNSFFPLYFSYLCILYLDLEQKIIINKKYMVTFIGMMITFFATYFISLELIYDYVRPDLISIVRSKDATPLMYGDYPGSWGSMIGDVKFQRFVGSFPDPIIFAYLLAGLAIYLITVNQYSYSLLVVILLLLTGSKGGWLVYINTIILFCIITRAPRLRWVTISGLISAQMMAAVMFHSSAFIHLQGLIGAINSLMTANLKSIFLGFGVGVGGNLQRFSAGSEQHGWLSSGSESGVGVLIYQLGITGLLVYFVLIYLIDKKLMNRFKRTKDTKYIYALGLIYATFINSFLQENCINSSIISIIVFVTLIIISTNRRRIIATHKIT